MPAWSLPLGEARGVAVPDAWREIVTRDWALQGSTGAVDVCIVDSGIEAGHPLVGPLTSAVAVVREGDEIGFVVDDEGDVCGHGTACAGIVRSLAPACRLHSVRVLGAGATGAGDLILAGLRHAIEAGHRVINLSLSTTKRRSPRSCTSSPTSPTSTGPSSSRRRTTCRSTASRGGLRR